jgi:hypothetical protein
VTSKTFRCIRCGQAVNQSEPCPKCDAVVRPYKGTAWEHRLFKPGDLHITPVHAQQGTANGPSAGVGTKPDTECGSEAKPLEEALRCQSEHPALVRFGHGDTTVKSTEVICDVKSEESSGTVTVRVEIGSSIAPRGFPVDVKFTIAENVADIFGQALVEAAAKARRQA